MLNLKNKQKQSIEQAPTVNLPVIPDKLYFTIGEVAKLCDLKTHVLRYWEQEFAQLNPSKRRGNRRYYQRKDVLLIRQIKRLLYQEGFTIEGARAQLTGEATQANAPQHMLERLQQTIKDLENLLAEIEMT